MKLNPRLINIKNRNRAMQSYVFTLFETVLEMRPKTIIEVGTQRGQSLIAMLLAIKENNFGRIISVDIKDRSSILDGEYEDLKKYCTFIKGSSYDEKTLEMVDKELNGESCDLLMLNGDHKNPGIGLDIKHYFPKVRKDGVIIMHDIFNRNEDVKDEWAKIGGERFGFNWGKAANNVIPGLGLIKKE